MPRDEVKLGPWPLGVANVRKDHLPGETRDALNTVFSDTGRAVALRNFGPVLDTHRYFKVTPSTRIDEAGRMILPKLGTEHSGPWMPPIGWDRYGGVEIVSCPGATALVDPELQVFPRTRPVVHAAPVGDSAPRWGLVAVQDGLASEPAWIEAASAQVQVPARSSVFITAPEGGDFYLYSTNKLDREVMMDVVPTRDLGAVLPERVLHARPFPSGWMVTLSRGRALLARGTEVWVSEPFAMTVTSALSFYRLPGVVTLLAGMETGVFIGTPDGVFFVDPVGVINRQSSMKQVSSDAPMSHSFVRVSGSDLGLDVPQVVAWVTVSGIQLGLPGGRVKVPRAGRFVFKGSQTGVLTFRDGRFYYLQQRYVQ